MAAKTRTDKTSRSLRILVVDDDPDVLDVAARRLESEGHTVIRAGDGVEGIRAAFQHRPDLILLDVVMPRIDGFQVCRFLKSYPPLDRIPIIFLTVRSGIGDRQRGLLRGGSDYVAKPLDMDEVRGKIDAVMKAARRAGQGPGEWRGGEELHALSDHTTALKLGEMLDESLYRLTVMEEISRAVAGAVTREDIIKILLVGCMKDIGLGFDRALYLTKDSFGRALAGRLALGSFPEAGLASDDWSRSLKRVRDKTLREIFERDLDSFPFLRRGAAPFIAGFDLEIPGGDRTYDLTPIDGGEDVQLMARRIAFAARKCLGDDSAEAVPVVAKGQLVGALVVDNIESGRPVTAEDLKNLLILCNQAGLALERCRLLDEQARWAGELERLGNLNFSVIESAGVGIAYLTPDGNIVTWNRALARLTGKEISRVQGRNIRDVFPWLPGSLVAERLGRVISERVEERVGHYRVTLGRRTGFYDLKMSPVLSRGTLEGVVLLVEDITKRVELEGKHREVFQFLSDVIDHSADAIVTVDPRGRIRTWNRAAESIFGLDWKSARGRVFGFMFPPDKASGRKEIMETVLSGNVVRDRETVMLTASGGRIYTSLSASPVLSAKGKVSAVSLFIRDTTERRKMITRLVQTEKLASLGVMAAGMAHEINNPLTSIVMLTQLLGATSLPPEAEAHLEHILREVDRVSEIVNDLLVYSREPDRRTENVDVGSILRQAQVFLQRKTSAEEVEVVCDIRKPLPPVVGRYNELLEIFLNLLTNAADALEGKGTVRITATAEPPEGLEEESGRWLKVVIRDTGHGISAADLPRIFDPFFTTKPPGKGTGLGLMVVNRLVEEYGGRIAVESRAARGATFTVFLPSSRAGAETA